MLPESNPEKSRPSPCHALRLHRNLLQSQASQAPALGARLPFTVGVRKTLESPTKPHKTKQSAVRVFEDRSDQIFESFSHYPPAEKQMSTNLNLLRENYCRPVFTMEKTDKGLFPLEKSTHEGSTMLARSPWKTLPYLKFDPSGLRQTYCDKATGAELPVFAVFNLEGSCELRAEIEMDRRPVFDASLNLANKLPFGKAHKFLEG